MRRYATLFVILALAALNGAQYRLRYAGATTGNVAVISSMTADEAFAIAGAQARFARLQAGVAQVITDSRTVAVLQQVAQELSAIDAGLFDVRMRARDRLGWRDVAIEASGVNWLPR